MPLLCGQVQVSKNIILDPPKRDCSIVVYVGVPLFMETIMLLFAFALLGPRR